MKKLLTCLVLIIVLYGCKSGMPGSPKKTVSSFIDAAKEGDLVEVKKYITSSDRSLLELGESFLSKLDSNSGNEMKEKMSREFKDKMKDAKIEIKEEKINGDKATVNVEFSHDGKSETRPFSLEKEDGQWKISLMSTGMNNSSPDQQQDIKEAMKKINMDSLAGTISEGMKEFDKIDKDSLKKVMKEAMKEVEKLKDTPKKN